MPKIDDYKKGKRQQKTWWTSMLRRLSFDWRCTFEFIFRESFLWYSIISLSVWGNSLIRIKVERTIIAFDWFEKGSWKGHILVGNHLDILTLVKIPQMTESNIRNIKGFENEKQVQEQIGQMIVINIIIY